jgi:TolA-binding protein
VHLDKYSDAIRELDVITMSVATTPDLMVEAVYWKGEVYFKARDFEKAREFYNKVLTGFPSSNYASFAAYSIAWSLYEEAKYKEALQGFSMFLSDYDPDELADEAELKIAEIL